MNKINPKTASSILIFLILIICVFYCLFSLNSRSASSEKTFNISVLLSRNIGPYNKALDGFKAGLDEQGIKAETTVYDLDGAPEEGHRVMKIIANSSCDLILAIGSAATEVVYNEEGPCPALYMMVLYPEDSGFVSQDLTRNTLTGVSLDVPAGRQFDVLKRLIPGIKSVGVIYNPAETKKAVSKAAVAARDAGIELVPIQVYSEEKVPDALEGLLPRVDALWAVADSTVFSSKSLSYVTTFTLRNKLPFMGVSSYFVNEGALLSMSPDYFDSGMQSSEMAAKILKGVPIKSIPFEAPRKYILSVNLRTARRIGIRIPDDVLSSADEVIK